jgi:lipopolysaccharide transport system ATP-binding protein
MRVAIKVENLSKAYQIGQFSTGTLSRDIERWFALIRGKEDPFLKIGEENNRSISGKSNIVLSLKNINFEINKGDAVGIIGKNGAGKSTLLKILSQVTTPTSGSVKIKGRVASLLEVGTGFHPELTGRENIFLNGAILGMRKNEIKKKFDEIVDFSGVERYIDTPVKRYSSGMYVRLAFAVAAHLESEILIVDEVLAVGDAEFQNKCLGKMGQVSKGQGKTVLFVSHNMDSIQQLCKNCLFLENGSIKEFGNSYETIAKYYATSTFYHSTTNKVINNKVRFNKIFTTNILDEETNRFSYNEEFIIHIEYLVVEAIRNTIIWFDVRKNGNVIFASSDADVNQDVFIIKESGRYKRKIKIPKNFLNVGNYSLVFGINSYKPDAEIERIENISIIVYDNGFSINPEFSQRNGYIKPVLDWKHSDQ